jgi:hypothetical protein
VKLVAIVVGTLAWRWLDPVLERRLDDELARFE